MPDPNEYDDKDKFMEVCIPMVLDDGTAKDSDQAVAICSSMWEKRGEEKTMKAWLEEWKEWAVKTEKK